jgi:hypothetical protein
MSGKDSRANWRELLVLVALGVPGAGLFIWGISSCASARHFGMPGVLGVFPGLALVATAGYYHYRTDYKDGPYKRPLVSFIGLAVFSALTAFLVNNWLFR